MTWTFTLDSNCCRFRRGRQKFLMTPRWSKKIRGIFFTLDVLIRCFFDCQPFRTLVFRFPVGLETPGFAFSDNVRQKMKVFSNVLKSACWNLRTICSFFITKVLAKISSTLSSLEIFQFPLSTIAGYAMQSNIPRSQEIPRNTWLRTVEEESRLLGKSGRQLKHMSSNRTHLLNRCVWQSNREQVKQY